MTSQSTPLAQRLSTYTDLSEGELSVLAAFHRHQRRFAMGTDLVHEGQNQPPAYILSKGWVCSYKVLRNGGRQIVDFQIPGDFLGLRSVLLRSANHCIEAVTDINASVFRAVDLVGTFETFPRLARAILWAISSDDAIVEERLVSLGRRDAVARTAHLLLELEARLQSVGLATKAGYDCPLSQYQLADALGLSAVHMNRVLRQLREEGLMTFRSGKVIFDDFDHLVHVADFDMGYLDYAGTKHKIDPRIATLGG